MMGLSGGSAAPSWGIRASVLSWEPADPTPLLTSEGGELRTLTSLCFDFTHSEDSDWGSFHRDSQWGDSSRNLNK